MERNLGFEADAEAFYKEWAPKEKDLADKISKARDLVAEVQYSSRDLISIASLTASLNVDGHRADLVILKAARAHAAFEGRKSINDLDIAIAAELALPHRIKRGPFHQSEMTMEQLHEQIENLQGEMQGEGTAEDQDQDASDKESADKKKAQIVE
jgi:Mg-chelatase subunit ChlI